MGAEDSRGLRVDGLCQARGHAAVRGILIADTKFEFALDPVTDEIVLVDEVLTPGRPTSF